MEKIKRKRRVTVIISDLVRIYIGKRVSRSAAELSYFLTLSIFPMLICLIAMMGNLFPTTESIIELMDRIVPRETIEAITEYIKYVSSRNNAAMITGGLIMMATSSAAAFRSLHHIMADIQGSPRFTGIFTVLVSFLFSLAFLAAIYFAATVLLTGNWFMMLIDEHFNVNISWAWSWLRFILLFLILFIILNGIYKITAPRDADNNLMLGAFIASVVLVGVSIVFSWFITVSVRYHLVYGSLTSLIILMVWLYLCGNILIMGNALNAVLRKERKISYTG